VQFYFRYAKGIRMQGGRYIPFTNLNILVSNKWTLYKNWKLNEKLKS
jgi:hypothetical protein